MQTLPLTQIIDWALFIFCWLSLVEALYSLRGGLAFRRFLLSQASPAPVGPSPAASLIVPCRGLDPGFRSNLEAFFLQDHPDYQLILVCDSPQDPCLPVLRSLQKEHPTPPTRIVIAGSARGRSQKVHNQLAALGHLREHDQAIAFGDSDIRPHQDWLRFLLAPLAKDHCAASTGFRWYVPQRGGWASWLRSVWNAGSLSLLSEKDSPFAWGGAMAMTRRRFQELEIARRWQGALSDDYALSGAVRESSSKSGRGICFQPHAISLSLEDCTWKELLEFTFRQMVITRVYHPTLWKLALAGQSLNTLSLWGSAVWLACSALLGRSGPAFVALWLSLIASIYLLGVWKAKLRLRALDALLPPSALRRRWTYLLLGPLAALVTLQALVRSAASREITWRGIRYRLHSPEETETLGEEVS
ncbi:MAG TPA: glycosyltransferase family 2 protein [Acidobacteriota bacterium]|nr:glycosyltransferase family 2 protein [Acidobacteriota bacterium]